MLSCLVLSVFGLDRRHLFSLVLWVPSSSSLSSPFLSFLFFSFPLLSSLILFSFLLFFLFSPLLSCLVLSRPFLSCLVLSCPFLSCLVLFVLLSWCCCVPSCSVLSGLSCFLLRFVSYSFGVAHFRSPSCLARCPVLTSIWFCSLSWQYKLVAHISNIRSFKTSGLPVSAKKKFLGVWDLIAWITFPAPLISMLERTIKQKLAKKDFYFAAPARYTYHLAPTLRLGVTGADISQRILRGTFFSQTPDSSISCIAYWTIAKVIVGWGDR